MTVTVINGFIRPLLEARREDSEQNLIAVVRSERLAVAGLVPSLSLRFFNGRTPACRFDILGHDGATFTWLRAAFDADTREHPF